ncbi:DNA recombination protein RmuC [Blattabacterium sp. (Blaberus giganteus)]|uniref:DNA recombination protein RmuC n=1 Tax=Blattabacterium sp. (Blaberus giganteus) TaxID=1186051 RepID=UPI00025F6E6B|nr:DNA recombination protein RmuC [Blattabacterium sp. (Blaberus giganteus)]AFJ90569.1 RmuC family protein [Blattabacterium sp. (Blaberus giganteus)]
MNILFVYTFLFFILFICIYFFRKLEFFFRKEFKDQQNEIQKLSKYSRTEIGDSLIELKNGLIQTIKVFQDIFDKKVQFYTENQDKKLGSFYVSQEKYLKILEKKLEEIRENVNDKLQTSLNRHLGKSFEIIGNQLFFLQEGLGEMKILAKDVSSLKRTLNHVRICGSFSEMQLSMLLQQILSPEQYASNVVTKSNTNFVVEFAIKLPGLEDGNIIWLPIDVKFPKETYEKLQKAYNNGEKKNIEIATKNMESVLKKMSKDIKDKYVDPPHTTDFAILFLPFEGIYAEITKNSSLLEELLRKHKTVIAGPSTLAAILNSLQIGFRTLAIQKRSSEVWKILETVKQEFTKFGLLLHQAQDKLQGASKDIDRLLGVKSNLIEKKLKDIEKI